MGNNLFHSVRIVKEPGSQARHVYVDGKEMKVQHASVTYEPMTMPKVWLCLLSDDVEIEEQEAEVHTYHNPEDPVRVFIDGKRGESHERVAGEDVQNKGEPAQG